MKNKNECHTNEKNSGFFSRLTFGWLSDIVDLGNRQTLQQEHLGPVYDLERTEDLVNRLECGWLAELQRRDTLTKQKPRLWRAVFQVPKAVEYFYIVFLCLLQSCSRILQPVFLSFLLSELQSDTWSVQVWVFTLAAGLCICSFIQAVARSHYMYHSLLATVHIRAAMTGFIYKKVTINRLQIIFSVFLGLCWVLTLRESVLAEIGSSRLLNLVAKDLAPFREAIPTLCGLLLVPLEIVEVSVLLCWLVDWRALFGIIYVVLILVYELSLGPTIKSLRGEGMLITDARLRLVGDSVQGIRLIKSNTWEDRVEENVKKLRRKELKLIGKKWIVQATFNALYSSYTVMTSLIALSSLLLSGQKLTAQNVFTTVALFAAIQESAVFTSAKIVYQFSQAMSSWNRLEAFLLKKDRSIIKLPSDNEGLNSSQQNQSKRQETRKSPTSQNKTQTDCSIETRGQTRLSLHKFSSSEHGDSNISLDIRDNEMVGMTGAVASGKTTILHTIAGELSCVTGSVKYKGRLVYVSQVPWLFSGTIRDNILFGEEFLQDKYHAVVHATTLLMDLHQLPRGDMTQIGERGVSLSGGQRARVSLARALYTDADIYLLDNPLSAVDFQVGQEILQRCIHGYLSDRLRILVTHQMRYIQKADRIIVVKNGQMSCHKDYSEMKESCKNFASFALKQNNDRQEISNKRRKYPVPRKKNEDGGDLSRADEDRTVGKVSLSLYWTYLRAGAPLIPLIFVLILLILPEGISLASNVWLEEWSKTEDSQKDNSFFFHTYIGLSIAVLSLSIFRAFTFFYVTLRSSETLHYKMLHAILRAPVVFFDTNPMGRLLNRFAKDIGWLDEALPYFLLVVIQSLVFFFGAVGLFSVANPWLCLGSVPYLLLSVYYARRAFGPAREIKRLEAISTSPVYSHFLETIEGILTIRSYKRQQTFETKYYRLQDENNKAYAPSVLVYTWLGFRLALLSAVMVTVVVFGSVLFVRDPALSGLIISYSMHLIGQFPRLTFWLYLVDQQMVSVERVLTYTKLSPEPGYTRITRPPLDWPREASIQLRQLSLRYHPEAPAVLKNLNFTISAGEKVGIVGRTGAGKSSLAAALLRMPDPQGEILIDDVPTSDMNIRDYRRVMTVIPQNPFLFNDTLRRNIDPTDRYSDAEVWRVMEKVKLSMLLQGRGKAQLNSFVTERGTNFSVGERQLICLARALLSRTKIVLLDEATANVDLETDRLVRDIIRREFKEFTVLTIAHRLDTVLECDRIMVLNEGEIVEFGKPDELLQRDGRFSRLFLCPEHH